jgi:hypothetical protein
MNYKEVFQLAQDKGCYTYSTTLNKNGSNNASLDEELQEIESSYVGNTKELVQQMRIMIIQKWLREQHHIDLAIRLDYEAGKYFYDLDAPNWSPIISDELSDTYEQALLEGIAEALKLI